MISSKQLARYCVTLGPLGFLPASGTWGTLCGLLTALFVANTFWFPWFVLAVAAVSSVALYAAGHEFVVKDPSEIIIDEYLGCLLMALCVPFSPLILAVGFAVFRFFDITKCCGVKWFESFASPWAVLLDDCWAALLAAGFVHLLLFWKLL